MFFLSKHALLFNLSLTDKKDAAVMFVYLMHHLTEAGSHQLSVSRVRHIHATLFHFLSEFFLSWQNQVTQIWDKGLSLSVKLRLDVHMHKRKCGILKKQKNIIFRIFKSM